MDDDEARLVEWLRGRDAECPLCKYNLRDLPCARCPECGNDLRLSVALVEPYQKAWIALMVATWAGAGIGLFFTGLLLTDGWPHNQDYLDSVIVIFIAMVPFAIVVAWKRRAFLQIHRQGQWMLAFIAAVIVVASFYAFFAMIR